jgi:hypothetical protein
MTPRVQGPPRFRCVLLGVWTQRTEGARPGDAASCRLSPAAELRAWWSIPQTGAVASAPANRSSRRQYNLLNLRQQSYHTRALDDGHCGLPTAELLSLTEGPLEAPVELVRTALDLELADRRARLGRGRRLRGHGRDLCTVRCHACRQVHLVNPSTGKVLGVDDGSSARSSPWPAAPGMPTTQSRPRWASADRLDADRVPESVNHFESWRCCAQSWSTAAAP